MEEIALSDKSPSMAGIFAGISKGSVWYDQPSYPTIGVAYSYCVGGYGIIGKLDGDKKRNQDFFESLFKDIRQRGGQEFEFSTENPKLCKALLELFKEKDLNSEMEYSYRLSHKIELSVETPLKMVTYHHVDRIFLEKMHQETIRNATMLMGRLENSWNSLEDFMTYSKAVVAMIGDQIVGVIIGSSRYKQFIVVDIEVEAAYRGCGIATMMVREFVNACVDEGLVVQWDHVESNQASKNLALKSGFILFKQRPYYWFDI